PALEAFYNAQQSRYELIELRERVEQRAMPRVELVDMRQEFQHTGEEQIFSRRLSEEVRARLERGEQAIVLLNRRGYSPVVLCRACGESVQCRDCAITLTYHKRANQLECHYCGYRQAVPSGLSSCSPRSRGARGAAPWRAKSFCRLIFRSTTPFSLPRSTITPASQRKNCVIASG